MKFYYKYKKYKDKYKYLNGGHVLGSGSTGEVFQVEGDKHKVIKIDRTGDGRVANEKNNYIELEEYQGTIIPKIYLENSNDSELILDKLDINIFDKLNKDGIELNKILISEIIKKINLLNKIGYCHNDLKFQNIGIKDNEVLLFDLEDISIRIYGTCQKDNIFKSLMQLLLEYLNEDNIDEYYNLLEQIQWRGTNIYDEDARVLLIKKDKLVKYPTSKTLNKEEALAYLKAKEDEEKKPDTSSSSSSSSSDSDEDEDDDKE